ncbi:hypothetical protein [Microvirga sp. 2TAF3]|uniref:hypothetical protein n=1 Tax=Microvirga sp. 2TAF3 TaxID=3233014 RepID=UPI003F993149
MTSAALPSYISRSAVTTLAIGLVSLATLAAGSAFAPVAVAQGWLMAFLFWSSIPVGSLILLLIHRLVGGRWGNALAPALLPAASLMPLVALAFLPVVFGLTAIYPWATQPAILPPDVSHFYLNAPSLIIRAFVALGGWSLLSILVVQGRCTKLTAGLGLAFHGFVVSFTAIDWILSVDPHFASTAFAASIAIQQILAALAWAAVSAPEAPNDPATADIGAFLIAALLGVVYLGLMSYIVIWYGDLPEKAAWYLKRDTNGWNWIITAAFLVGAAIPLAMLLKRSLRQSRRVLRIVGGMILVGIWLHVEWLVAPTFVSGWLIAAAIAMVAMAGISVGLIRGAMLRPGRNVDHAE